MKETIALDFDGVICDFNTKLLKTLESCYGIKLLKEQLSNRDIPNLIGISTKGFAELEDYVVSTSSGFPLIDGAEDGIKYLAKRYNLVIFTARWDNQKPLIEEWLENNNLWRYFEEVYTAAEKEGKKRLPKVDFLVDDSPKKIANLCSLVNKQCYLFENQQNSGSIDVFNMYKQVKDWDDLISCFPYSIIPKVVWNETKVKKFVAWNDSPEFTDSVCL